MYATALVAQRTSTPEWEKIFVHEMTRICLHFNPFCLKLEKSELDDFRIYECFQINGFVRIHLLWSLVIGTSCSALILILLDFVIQIIVIKRFRRLLMNCGVVTETKLRPDGCDKMGSRYPRGNTMDRGRNLFEDKRSSEQERLQRSSNKERKEQ